MQGDLKSAPRMSAMLLHPLRNPLNTHTSRSGSYVLTNGKQGYGSNVDNMFTAAEDYKAAAADGDSIAMNNLGCLYARHSIDRSVEIAAWAFKESEEMDCTVAIVNQGMMWEDEGDYEQAWRCYRRAYMLGDRIGQFCHAAMYEHGLYVTRDEGYAFRQYLELARDGYGDAYGRMAHMLEDGRGVARDLEEAIAWYRCGEACGDPDSTYELALHYYRGQGVKRDDAKGRELLETAGRREEGRAFLLLGQIYENGDGVKQDRQRAYSYYYRGCTLNNRSCMTALQRMCTGQTDLPENGDDWCPEVREAMALRLQNVIVRQDPMERTSLVEALTAYHNNPSHITRRAVIRALLEEGKAGERLSEFYVPRIRTTDGQYITPFLGRKFDDGQGRGAVPVLVETELSQPYFFNKGNCVQRIALGSLKSYSWTYYERIMAHREEVGGILLNPDYEACYIPIDVIRRMDRIRQLLRPNVTATSATNDDKEGFDEAFSVIE